MTTGLGHAQQPLLQIVSRSGKGFISKSPSRLISSETDLVEILGLIRIKLGSHYCQHRAENVGKLPKAPRRKALTVRDILGGINGFASANLFVLRSKSSSCWRMSHCIVRAAALKTYTNALHSGKISPSQLSTKRVSTMSKVYVGNIPWSFDNDDLAKALESAGTIVSATVQGPGRMPHRTSTQHASQEVVNSLNR